MSPSQSLGGGRSGYLARTGGRVVDPSLFRWLPKRRTRRSLAGTSAYSSPCSSQPTSAPYGPQRLERRRLDLEWLHAKRFQTRNGSGCLRVSVRIRSNDRVRIVRAVQTSRVTRRARRSGGRRERAHFIRESASGNEDSERYCDGYLFHMPAL